LASYRDESGQILLAGALQAAAVDLATHGTQALIVTGFCVMADAGPTAETDGPPGAVYLAAMLRRVGIEAAVSTDAVGAPVVREGLSAAGLPESLLVEIPLDASDAAILAVVASSYSHVVAVERVGPSHTLESIAAQYPTDEAVRREFAEQLPVAERNVCHNMRGTSIDAHTASLDLLFPPVGDALDGDGDAELPRSIGIVDGGNEIGCGRIPWDVVRRAVTNGMGGTIACRVATDHTIVAGVSNWGAYALGAAVAVLRGHGDDVREWTSLRQRELIEAMVVCGGAVDGVTKRRECTVDGLAMDDYLAVFEAIRAAVLGD